MEHPGVIQPIWMGLIHKYAYNIKLAQAKVCKRAAGSQLWCHRNHNMNVLK